MAKTYEAGEIKILKFDIVSHDGELRQSIISQIVAFDVYENIRLPVQYCDVVINDSINILEEFPIIGEEMFEIEIQLPGMESTVEYEFAVLGVTNKVSDPQSKFLTYIIQSCSVEIIRNTNNLISKKYKGNPYSAVEEILTKELKTDKLVNFDPSSVKGDEEMRMSRLTPFQSIDLIRQQTVSQKYKSSSFVFFENRNGFNFVTLESLFDIKKNDIGDKIFFYDTAVQADQSSMRQRNILGYSQVIMNNTIDLLSYGGLSNKTTSFDLRTATLDQVQYDIKNETSKFKQTDDNEQMMKTGKFINERTEDDSVHSLFAFNSKNGTTFRQEKYAHQKAFLEQISQNVVRLKIYGDPVATAGAMIDVRYPKIDGLNKKQSVSKLSSGHYLVSKCRHMFTMRTRPEYKIAMECVKSSYGESE
jgi:exonuclease III